MLHYYGHQIKIIIYFVPYLQADCLLFYFKILSLCMQTQQKEVGIFNRHDMPPQSEWLQNSIQWQEEKNTHGGMIQEGAEFMPGVHVTRNRLYGDGAGYAYGINANWGTTDAAVFEWQLMRLKAGKGLAK
jgi:hypothetical protein